MEGKDHPTTAFTTKTVQLISNALPSREGQVDVGPPAVRKARDKEASAPGTSPWKEGKVSRVCAQLSSGASNSIHPCPSPDYMLGGKFTEHQEPVPLPDDGRHTEN